MKDELFAQLIESVREGGTILREESSLSRKSNPEIRRKATEFDLEALVAALDEVGKNYQWQLEEIHGIGDLSELGTTMRAVEAEVEQSSTSIEISWQRLKKVAECLDDLFDLKLLGRNPERADRIEIMLFDSSYWIVKGDQRVLELVEAIS